MESERSLSIPRFLEYPISSGLFCVQNKGVSTQTVPQTVVYVRKNGKPRT